MHGQIMEHDLQLVARLITAYLADQNGVEGVLYLRPPDGVEHPQHVLLAEVTPAVYSAFVRHATEGNWHDTVGKLLGYDTMKDLFEKVRKPGGDPIRSTMSHENFVIILVPLGWRDESFKPLVFARSRAHGDTRIMYRHAVWNAKQLWLSEDRSGGDPGGAA